MNGDLFLAQIFLIRLYYFILIKYVKISKAEKFIIILLSELVMKFYKKLYIGDTIKNPDKIKRKLKKYAKLTNIYVIAYMEKDRRIEIFHSIMLQQPYYKDNPPYVIGIAGSKEEANNLICRITEEAVRQTETADLIAYLFGEPRARN